MAYADRHPRSSILLLFFFCTSIFLAPSPGHADIPTPEQECRLRNSAICEINGVQHYVEGGCPQGAIVIRPHGNERCDELVQVNKTTGQTNQIKGPPRKPPASKLDTAHSGKTGHWLITALTIAAVLGGIFSILKVLRRLWLQLNEQNSAVGRIASVFRAILSLGLSGYAFYYTFGLVYMRVFDSFSNHETFGPAFFAAPPAFFASILAAAVVFQLAYWAIGAIIAKYNSL